MPGVVVKVAVFIGFEDPVEEMAVAGFEGGRGIDGRKRDGEPETDEVGVTVRVGDDVIGKGVEGEDGAMQMAVVGGFGETTPCVDGSPEGGGVVIDGFHVFGTPTWDKLPSSSKRSKRSKAF